MQTECSATSSDSARDEFRSAVAASDVARLRATPAVSCWLRPAARPELLAASPPSGVAVDMPRSPWEAPQAILT